MTKLSALLGLALLPAMAQAQTMTPAQAEAIAGDPPATPQRLKLVDVPTPTGPARSLFNGRDLADWEPWLGYADPSVTYRDDLGMKPIGTSRDLSGDFAVRTIDGAPAIWIKGETWGSLVHKADLANYHLSLEFKWGDKVFAPRLTLPQNNGLLYHSHGAHGAVYGTWMTSVEFEIMKGSTGMVVPVGKNVRARTYTAYDPAIIYPHRRFQLGGRDVDVTTSSPAWNVEGAVDAEKAVGEWNRLDLYVLGDRAIHVVNGVPVMELRDLAVLDPANGERRPLTRGRIQFQSEGAETWFRNITVQPIDRLPRIVPAD